MWSAAVCACLPTCPWPELSSGSWASTAESDGALGQRLGAHGAPGRDPSTAHTFPLEAPPTAQQASAPPPPCRPAELVSPESHRSPGCPRLDPARVARVHVTCAGSVPPLSLIPHSLQVLTPSLTSLTHPPTQPHHMGWPGPSAHPAQATGLGSLNPAGSTHAPHFWNLCCSPAALVARSWEPGRPLPAPASAVAVVPGCPLSCAARGCERGRPPAQWEVLHEYLKASVSGGQAGWGRLWDPLPPALSLGGAGQGARLGAGTEGALVD